MFNCSVLDTVVQLKLEVCDIALANLMGLLINGKQKKKVFAINSTFLVLQKCQNQVNTVRHGSIAVLEYFLQCING